MRWPVAMLLNLGMAATILGCRSRGDLLEAELRTKESEVYNLRDQLQEREGWIHAQRREIEALRQGGHGPVSPEAASQIYTLKSLALGRQTGGLNDDGNPGDEALQVVVEPRDPDGHAIKAPGTVVVRAVEITSEGLKKPLSAWMASPEQVRKSWRPSLFSTGYFLTLPWKVWPCTEKLRVTVQFILTDGRAFEADKDVTIRLAPAEYRRINPSEFGDPPGVTPAEAEPLAPQPRMLEGLPSDGTSVRRSSPANGKPGATQPAAMWQPPPPPSALDGMELQHPEPLRDRP